MKKINMKLTKLRNAKPVARYPCRLNGVTDHPTILLYRYGHIPSRVNNAYGLEKGMLCTEDDTKGDSNSGQLPKL